MLKMKARKERKLPNLWQVAFDDERRVVASCLLSPALLSKCGVLAPTHFTNSDCRAVWSVMASLYALVTGCTDVPLSLALLGNQSFTIRPVSPERRVRL